MLFDTTIPQFLEKITTMHEVTVISRKPQGDLRPGKVWVQR